MKNILFVILTFIWMMFLYVFFAHVLFHFYHLKIHKKRKRDNESEFIVLKPQKL